MEKIEIYTSKKKSFLLIIGSLLFVVGGIYIFMNAENFTSYRARSPLFTKAMGIASILFFVGMHEFYIKEKGKEDVLTGKARFTHVYLLENNQWILKEVLSYDHQ